MVVGDAVVAEYGNGLDESDSLMECWGEIDVTFGIYFEDLISVFLCVCARIARKDHLMKVVSYGSTKCFAASVAVSHFFTADFVKGGLYRVLVE